ncbi:MAG: sulfotransferase [Steroidobacteraceae bacterium]|nr:sulfotransferase [Steroidobacteraceae bacterium]MBP7012295.1 sulfotransferase [Steroidobacteraceae bacterium]
MSSTNASIGTIDAEVDQAARLLQSQPATAARRAQELLRKVPGHPPAMLLLGMALRNQGRLSDALERLAPLAHANPRWAPAHYELGVTLGLSARPGEAIECLHRAARLQPGIGTAWLLIADHLFELGDPSGADRAYANHLVMSTTPPHLFHFAAITCDDRFADAAAQIEAYLTARPNDVHALRLLAETKARLGMDEEAAELLSRALVLSPELTEARSSYAVILNKLGRTVECLAQLQSLLATDPENPSYLNLKANALTSVGDFAGALAAFDKVLADYPSNAGIWLAFGHALKTAGRRDECIRAYRRAIELAPGLGEAYWSLANLKTFRFTPADIAAMRIQLDNPKLQPEHRPHFHFALGKAMEDESRYEESFVFYAEGNRLRRGASKYDPSDTTAHVKRSKTLFTRGFFRDRAGWGCQNADPIFIVGMPRAGSTLLEQILSSHSMVEGTMELPDITQIARSLLAGDSTSIDPTSYPGILAGLGTDQLRELGERYLEQTRVLRRSGAPYFIDKMPNNWAHVGFIHLILPNAKIVDARRHPLSGCFSIFKQLFARGQPFSYSLEDIGQYYQDYVELMAHFDVALPGRVHRVIYERMIDDTEAEIRHLLAYCGLPFEETCLRFYKNERAVRTPSAEQVRRPIFRDGIDQWRNYETWLDPLRIALGPVLDAYPDAPRYRSRHGGVD